MNLKWMLLPIIVLSMTALLSGCSSEGINEKLIIHGIGIDKEEDKYVVTMHVLNTSALSDEGGDDAEEIETISESGYTILDAITKIERISGKKALYSHNLILVIGKETAKNYTDKILSFFSSDYNLRPSVEILIADTTAKNVLNIKNDDKLITADDIMSMVDTAYNKGDQLKFTLKGFLGDMQSDFKSAKALFLNVSQDTLENDILQINNMAVFKNEAMQGVLTEDETKGFLMVSGKTKNIEQDIEVEGNNLSCIIKKSKCTIETYIENEVPMFDISINATANVYNESIDSGIKIKTELERKICELVEKSIKKALEEYKCDIFNFSRYLMNKDISYFKYNMKNINDILAHSKYYINSNVKVNYMSKNSSLFEE